MVSASQNPSERSLHASRAAHSSWARTVDRPARTEPARRAFLQRFEDQVDPDRVLPEPERIRRAEHARKAYFTGLALKSAVARRKASQQEAADG